jgi:hypothetical protein
VRIDGIWYGFGGPVWYFDGAWRHFVVLIVVFDAPICGDGNDNRNSNRNDNGNCNVEYRDPSLRSG